MRWPFTKWDILLFLFLVYRISSDIISWSDYKTCEEPIQISLIGLEITLFALRISYVLDSAPDISDSFRQYLTYFGVLVLNPACLIFPVQGATWQMRIFESPSECPTTRSEPLVLWLVSCCAMTAMMSFFLTWGSLIFLLNWWKLYQFRRRMMRLNNMVANGEYDALNQMLVEGGLNDNIGLLPGEIEKLKRGSFSQRFIDRLSAGHLETCPICYEDYKTGDEIISLPKCSHAFHPGCVAEWLVRIPLCPLCRRNVRISLYDVERQEQRSGRRVLEDIEDPRHYNKRDRIHLFFL